MPTTIRLARGGTKKRPYFRIVVANSRSPRDGDFIEKIGTYNPLLQESDPKRITLDAERAKYWLSVGAQVSRRVHLFLNRQGVVTTLPAQRAARKPKKEQPAAAETALAEAPAAAAPAA